MIKYINAAQAHELITSTNTCIINIVAEWCSDCTQQADNFPQFAHSFTEKGIAVYQVNVQKVKNDFLSDAHQELTTLLGGPGYPRTVLIKKGKIIDADNVEVISDEALGKLAEKFEQAILS
ncbi:peroxiredoxin family protein [Psychromonas ossibalaenae]|uniref:peroxiredoxin family protein n=1 Tax=Psychromonas ossibalaenae TaxID=444922 RepID=UPI0003754973|nr:redoxin domain-containing protein [Psychromonas ossibalaenae]